MGSSLYSLLWSVPNLWMLAKESLLMKCMQRWLFSGLLFFTSLAQPARADSPKKIDFAHDIVPILKARCAECHTNGKYKAGMSFDTREELLRTKTVVPGQGAASELVKRVSSKDKKVRMPPKGEHLAPNELELLR